MSREQYELLQSQGIEVETVGQIIEGDAWNQPAERCPPPGGREPFPEPGIYFGMPEDTYHAILALSASGIKEFSVSCQDFWETSDLNPDKVERDNATFFDFGNALHCFVLEGEQTYSDRYAVELDKADFEADDLLITTDQIKAAIVASGAKPCTRGFDDNTRAARKEDWCAQLIEIDPRALIWDQVISEYGRANSGKTFIAAWMDRRVRISARIIAAHEEIALAFTRGHSEVSVFWYCRITGCPMKARLDYLKMRTISDLKTFSNKGGRTIRSSINTAIGSMFYNVQHVVYVEAAEAAKAMIRECPGSSIHGDLGQREWALRWAKKVEEPRFMFAFIKSDKAPVLRGRFMPTGTVYSVTKSRVTEIKRQFVHCIKTFGAETWLDIEPVDEVDDNEIPIYATDIGK